MIVRGRRPAAQAWADYAVIARWPAWSPQLTSVEASAERIAPGVTGTVRSGPLRLPFTITAVDEDAMTWSWRVLGVGMVHGVRATPTGCLTTFEGPLPYLPFARVALRRLVSADREQPGDRLDG